MDLSENIVTDGRTFYNYRRPFRIPLLRDDGRIHRDMETYRKPSTYRYIDFNDNFALSSITHYKYRKLYMTLMDNKWKYRENIVVCVYL